MTNESRYLGVVTVSNTHLAQLSLLAKAYEAMIEVADDGLIGGAVAGAFETDFYASLNKIVEQTDIGHVIAKHEELLAKQDRLAYDVSRVATTFGKVTSVTVEIFDFEEINPTRYFIMVVSQD